MINTYKCSFCGKSNVKLWHPYMEDGPLFCTDCAKKRRLKLYRPHKHKVYLSHYLNLYPNPKALFVPAIINNRGVLIADYAVTQLDFERWDILSLD